MAENNSNSINQAPANNNNSTLSNNMKPKPKYQGEITSKEAGNIVRDMIHEQEKAMMSTYEKENMK